jgi:hypothetical protein
MEDNEVRNFGYCEECGSEVTEEHYITEDGKVLCCIECVLEHCHIHVVEV